MNLVLANVVVMGSSLSERIHIVLVLVGTFSCLKNAHQRKALEHKLAKLDGKSTSFKAEK